MKPQTSSVNRIDSSPVYLSVYLSCWLRVNTSEHCDFVMSYISSEKS
jgi:hypothetical protein